VDRAIHAPAWDANHEEHSCQQHFPPHCSTRYKKKKEQMMMVIN
jgi:hypothetical protein